ncbi:MAG: UvrD-helicase domain-containing protein [Succinatimonas hippei]|nr:UvrD-helicase domain-containing protein [Succinatimonas hippei]
MSFELTSEQREIIQAVGALPKDGSLKIDACAGSGKTATLVAIANACPDKKFLYLAFNKAIVTEASNKFPGNVKAVTVNALAYHWFVGHYGRKPLASLSPYDVKNMTNLPWKDVGKVIAAYKAYCNSARSALTEESIKDPVYDTDRYVFQILSEIMKGVLPVTHEFYLKMYQLRDKFPELRRYDAILLDEAQDTNDVTFSIFKRFPGLKILVGDSHQGIYGFRGAVNQLRFYEADVNLPLSVSFRCCQQAVDRANFFINLYAEDRETTKPMTSAADDHKLGTMAMLSRTNAELISVISKIRSSDRNDFRLVRSADEVFAPAEAVYAYRNGERVSGEYGWIGKFKSIPEFDEFVNSDACPADIFSANRLVNKVKSELFFIKRQAEMIENNEDGYVYLSTAHSSKGLEFDDVMILPDFCPLFISAERMADKDLEEKQKLSPQDFQQEVNLLYTAITRSHLALDDESGNFAQWLARNDDQIGLNAMQRVRVQYEEQHILHPLNLP